MMRTALILMLLSLVACRSADDAPLRAAESVNWSLGDPTTAGFDSDALDYLAMRIRAGKFPNTHALLIAHDGALVFERYFAGTDERHSQPLGRRLMDRDSLHDLRSVTKSVTATLVGIALADDFEKKVSRPITEFLPRMQLGPDHRKITLHHVLTMTAGLQWNEMESPYTDAKNDAIRLLRVTDPTAFVLSRKLAHKPGTTWYYNGGCTEVLANVISHRTGQTIEEFAHRRLFEPLGIDKYEWTGPRQWKTRNASAKAGLRLTARGLAKIGALYLNGGRWRGRQILPEAWIKLATTRHVKAMGKWSGRGMWGYGYQWKVGKVPSGDRVIAGFGNGNQRLFLVPARRLVVTIFAGQYNQPFQPHSEMILKRVLAAHSSTDAPIPALPR